MSVTDGPTDIVWDMTYACPLRCTHCYSESGRRPSRQLDPGDLLRVADALLTLEPQAIVLSGGEPLVVRGVVEVIERISAAGVPVVLYTSGWPVHRALAERLASVVSRLSVSVDGASADVHDRVRGRAGSFDRAMAALGVLDDVVADRTAAGLDTFEFGMDCTLVRSSFDQMDDYCTTIARRFPAMRFIWFGAAMPIGLASRPGFVAAELLSDAQADRLASPAQLQHLRSLAPATVEVSVTDNRLLQMRPDLLAAGRIPAMQVEPDGAVRAMAIYEGTVGNVLTESPTLLWQRAMARWRDPFVADTLAPVRTMAQWAEATRRIDYRFGSDDDRARIDRRPQFVSATGMPERAR